MSNGGAVKRSEIFSIQEIHRFVKECMISLGTPEAYAEALAKCITEADYRGHTSDGLNRLETYIKEVSESICDKTAAPEIIKQSPVTALVNGNNALGVIVSNFCMNLAIDKAKNCGIGWVVAKGSNRFGIAGHYPLQALKEGMLGMSFSNASPLVAPTRGNERAIGTNPIAFGAPALDGDNFLLDMSTSTVPVGKIEFLSKRGLPVPEEWADSLTGTLYPMGGPDPELNYKGFGLGMVVEILCSILSGSDYGPKLRKYGDLHQVSNFGHCFVAINPTYFEPGFEERLSDFMDYIRNVEPIDPAKPVLVPGDSAKESMANIEQEGGVRYVRELIDSCNKYAKKLNVDPLTPIH